jgi:hypothetical protein
MVEQPSVIMLVSNHGAEAKGPPLPARVDSCGQSARHICVRLGWNLVLGLHLGILLNVDVVVGLEGIHMVIRELDARQRGSVNR